jgi:uncharacterized protein
MRVVLDTNIVVSGLLWRGPEQQLLYAARQGQISLYTTQSLLEELLDVLIRPRFAVRLTLANLTAHALVEGYAVLATIVEAALISPTIQRDPDDDAVLACALAAQAELVVSGDHHLLNQKSYHGIPIVRATDCLHILTSG